MIKKIGILVAIAAILASITVPSVLACVTYTPGYWKNHPDAWPTNTITLGGVTHTKEQAIGILNTPPQGNAVIILQKYLIAAKLSVAMGETGGVLDTLIEQADAWLAGGAVDRAAGIAIAEQLGAILEQYAAD